MGGRVPIEGEGGEREPSRRRGRGGIFPKRTFNLSNILLRYLDYLLMDI